MVGGPSWPPDLDVTMTWSCQQVRVPLGEVG